MPPAAAEGAPVAGPRRTAFAASCVAALLLLLAAYSNHFDNDFHFDDSHVIVDNPAIRSLDHVHRFFTDARTYTARPQNATYRPLLTLSYALDYRMAGGLEPRAFHRTQFGLLLVLGLALFLLYRRILDLGLPGADARWIALAGATLFCVHTANTQTVNYLSSRSALLSTLGIVLAVLCWTWPAGRRWHLYLVPLLAFGLAKPLTVMVAPILWCYVLLFEERCSFADALAPRGLGRATRALVGVLPALVAGLALFAFLSRMDAETLRLSPHDRSTYFLSQPFVWLHYLRLFVLPLGLTADADWQLVSSWYDTRTIAGLAGMALLLWLAVRLSRDAATRPAAFGLAWFTIALVPESTVFPLSELYNEHRIFFPYVGLTLAACALVAQLLARGAARGPAAAARGRRTVAACAIALLAAHAAGTFARNRVWATEETLWGDVAEKSPRNGRGLMNYGLTKMRKGELREALALFERAQAFTPNYSILEVNLGIVQAALGEHAAAEPHFRRAIELEPDYAGAYTYYARWLVERGRAPEASERLDRAIALNPADVAAQELRLRLAAASGEPDLVARAERVLRQMPTSAVAAAFAVGSVPHKGAAKSAVEFADLGWKRTQQEQWVDAAILYAQATRLGHDAAQAWNNLGWARLELGFRDAAIADFERALALDPGFELARGNLNHARAVRPEETGAD